MGKGKSCPRSQWAGQKKPLSGKSQLQLESRPPGSSFQPSLRPQALTHVDDPSSLP